MKKSLYLLVPAAALVGIAAALMKKKSMTKMKITCRCGENGEKTETVVTDKELKDGETVEVDVPANGKGPISIGLNTFSIGNVNYNITLK
jgi:hypothetical protein